MKAVVNLICAISLGACTPIVHSFEKLIAFDQSVLIELGWPPLKYASGLSTQSCPNMVGRYRQKSDELFLSRDGDRNPVKVRREGSAIYFYAHPRNTKGGAAMGVIEASEPTDERFKDTFAIAQGQNDLKFRIPLKVDSTKVFRVTLDASFGDYTCKDGRLFFVNKKSRGYSDGGEATYESESFIAPLEDGSLLFFRRTHGTTSRFLIFSNSRATQTFARFPLEQ